MPNIKLTKDFITGWQIAQMAAALNWCRHRTLGVYVHFIAHSQDALIEQGPQSVLSPMLTLHPGQAAKYFNAMLAANLVTLCEDGTYAVAQNKGIIARHKRHQEVGREAGKKSVAAKQAKAPAKPRKKAAIAKAEQGPDMVAIETAFRALCRQSWESYAQAYTRRYRTAPVQNAKNNSLIKQVTNQLGKNTPDVLAFYVNHPGRLYVSALHALDLASRDAASLHTQWKNNQFVTPEDVRQHQQMSSFRRRQEQILAGEI